MKEHRLSVVAAILVVAAVVVLAIVAIRLYGVRHGHHQPAEVPAGGSGSTTSPGPRAGILRRSSRERSERTCAISSSAPQGAESGLAIVRALKSRS